MLKKEWKKNKVIFITISIFVILASLLMTIGTVVIMQTADSMNALFEIANPPHFLQMHTGEIDRQEIEDFAKKDNRVEAYEIVEMLNVDAANIWYQRQNAKDSKLISMSGNMMDNGFVSQNRQFDFLVDENNEVIKQADGQIGVPINYKTQYGLALGDTLMIQTEDFYKEYVITQFVRDAQMASTLASSTRFLMSDADHEELIKNLGEPEYILEYLFDDSGYASEFQKKYEAEDSGMPKNGQAITYPLIKMLNVLASGLTAGMMVLISALLIAIAVFILKYTILSSLEEDVYEIGVLKAIGISNKDIEKQYFVKYRVIGVIGCIIGYVLGLILSRLFTASIRTMFGSSDMGIAEILLPIVTVFAVYLMIITKTRKVLKRIRKVTVVQALVHGEMSKPKKEKNHAGVFPLKKFCNKHVNIYLGIKELFAEKKMWILIAVVFLLASNVILNPLNLVSTFRSPRISEYMGLANCDVEVIIQAQQDLAEKCNTITNEVKSDPRITDYSVYAVRKYHVVTGDGEESLQVEMGEYHQFSTNCIEGRTPQAEGEMALSYLNAKKLGKGVGDSVTVYENHIGKPYIVCGVYQDITSGGYTAKMYANQLPEDAKNYMILFNCKDSEQISEVASYYDRKYDSVKSLPLKEYAYQTFGSVIDSFEKAAIGVVMVVGIIILLIMVLFLKLHGAKHQKTFVMYQVLGFNESDQLKQYLVKVGLMASLGIVLGVLTTNTIGAMLVGGLLSLAGVTIANFKYIGNIWMNLLICPAALLVLALIITTAYVRTTRTQSDVRLMQE